VAVLARRALLVVNPAARRGARARDIAAGAFAASGVECETFVTERPGQAGEIAVAHRGDFDAVFTLGGDGTAMDVIGALSGSGFPVGVLPGGTGNLIARSLGIPLDVRRAVPLLLRGEIADIDLGRLSSGRCFAFAAGVGIDATMIERTPANLKRRLGVGAYALTAARAVLARERFKVRATVDGTVHERMASAVMVTNFGAVLNRLITLGPDIAQDDGLLDLCVFSPETLRDAVRVMWRLLRRDFRSDPCVLYAHGRHFRIETDPPRLAQADGELLEPTPFEVTVEPRAARLLVPRTD
jgi:diacylglycerol kinase (ATP)